MNVNRAPVSSSLFEVPEAPSPKSSVLPLSVLQMVAHQIERNPGAPAIVSANQSISYRELDTRSNVVARRLSAAGLVSNAVVAIYLESSIELIVSALGIWKAGGAYLPIDPAYPAERATYIVSDSGAPILITRRGLASALGAGEWTTLCIDDDIALEADGAVAFASVTPHDLAYVVYTSGTTGRPKGVEITHGNLLNLVKWHNAEFLVTSEDRASQIAGVGFDAAVWELWPYLAAGAAIHLPSRETRLSASQLRDWLVAEKITVSFVPTVLAEVIVRMQWPPRASLRFLLTGGDLLRSFPSARIPFQFINNYGPTECTVVAASGLVNALREQSLPAIGRAILSTSIYLLDESGNEVNDGDVGEIYIGGSSVGRGYRHQPELTAASFVPVTIGGVTERTFRTGDLARRLSDGQLAFVGRIDDQIKIRGFRINPAEIANVINRHPLIVSSAVIARTDDGEKRLVAYVVAAAGAEICTRELRGLLARSLPNYMMPSNFVLLGSIPVTANGKLDKAALPAPAEKNQLRDDSYVAPRNGVEEIVEGVLSPILGLPKVGIYDNFFLLGGHSLMGAQLIARVRDIFDVELTLRDVFECPTVVKLAAKIQASLTQRLETMSEDEVHRALGRDNLDGAIDSSTIKAG